MKVYHITHPDMANAFMRIAVDANDQVAKLYVVGTKFSCMALMVMSPTLRLSDNKELVAVISATHYVHRLKKEGCEVREDKPELATNVKIALWCRLWKEYKGKKWVIGGPDAKRIAELSLDEELLRWYLNDKDMPQTAQTWLWRGKQSIANLFHYINQVRVAMAAPPPSIHPDHWSKEHMAKLDGQGVGEYHKHLKSLGLVAKKHPDGSILDYVKP